MQRLSGKEASTSQGMEWIFWPYIQSFFFPTIWDTWTSTVFYELQTNGCFIKFGKDMRKLETECQDKMGSDA